MYKVFKLLFCISSYFSYALASTAPDYLTSESYAYQYDLDSVVSECASKFIFESNIASNQFPPQYRSEYDLKLNDSKLEISKEIRKRNLNYIEYSYVNSIVRKNLYNFVQKLRTVIPDTLLALKTDVIASQFMLKQGLNEANFCYEDQIAYRNIKNRTISKMQELMRNDRRSFVREPEVEQFLAKEAEPFINKIKYSMHSANSENSQYVYFEQVGNYIHSATQEYLNKEGINDSMLKAEYVLELDSILNTLRSETYKKMEGKQVNYLGKKEIDKLVHRNLRGFVTKLKSSNSWMSWLI